MQCRAAPGPSHRVSAIMTVFEAVFVCRASVCVIGGLSFESTTAHQLETMEQLWHWTVTRSNEAHQLATSMMASGYLLLLVHLEILLLTSRITRADHDRQVILWSTVSVSDSLLISNLHLVAIKRCCAVHTRARCTYVCCLALYSN